MSSRSALVTSPSVMLDALINSRSALSRYGIAFLAVVLAAALRFAILPWVPHGLPFLTFFIAVMLGAWHGGIGPGLFASFLSLLIADFFFIEPTFQFRVESHYVVGLVVFCLETVAVSLLAENSKRLETALRKTETQFRTAFQWASVGKTQVDTSSGRFLEVNQAFCRMTGYEREELLHMTPEDLTHPEDRPSHTIDTAALLTGERDQSGLEKRYIRKDGSIIWVQVESALIRHPDGRPYCTIAVILDITARRHAEEVGRRRTAQFETLLNQAPLGVYLVDADFRIAQVNPVARPVFGDIPDLVGRDFHDVIRLLWNSAYAGELVAIFHHTLDTGESYVCPERAEYRIDRGITEYYEWRVDRITLPNGRYGLVCYFRDISAQVIARQTIADNAHILQRLNTELEMRVEERTRALVASQEHLRSMATELNLAEQRERRRLAETLHDHLQQILVLGKLKVGQGQRLAQTVPACADLMTQVDDVLTDALTFTRTLVTELSPPVLHEHGLTAGLEWLADHMKKHDLTVTVEVSPDEDIQLPEDQSVLLFQSVRELLINSGKHGGTGQATVTLEHREDQLHITVSDKGQGFDLATVMAAAALDKNTNRETSTKFGLFSIRERMKALGGSFELKAAPGKGTTARLTLPLSRPPDRQGAPSHPLSNVPDTHGSPSSGLHNDHTLTEPSHRLAVVRLLLVDDHAMVRQGLRVLLESHPDIQVIGEACDGQQAVELTQQLEPSVVVMDINMPGMNGIEATARITGSHPHPVVIGLSVNADGENQHAMKMAGAAILLTKDAVVEHLYTAIQDSLHTMRARKTADGFFPTSS